MNNIRLRKDGTLTEEKIIHDSSYETLIDAGWEPIDNSDSSQEGYARLSQKLIYNALTGRQRKVLCLLNEGHTRKEIANELLIGVQAVNQIIPRIRKRLRKAGIGNDRANNSRQRNNKKLGVRVSHAEPKDDSGENLLSMV